MRTALMPSAPGAGLRGLGINDARVVRQLGGNVNMHSLVEAGGQRMVLRRYGQWRSREESTTRSTSFGVSQVRLAGARGDQWWRAWFARRPASARYLPG